MASSSQDMTTLLLLLLAACAVLPGGLCAEAEARPQIFRADNGTLHINSGENETVLINGVDLVAENSRLNNEVAALKQRRESDSGTGWPLCDRPYTLCVLEVCGDRRSFDSACLEEIGASVFSGVKHVIGSIRVGGTWRQKDLAHLADVETISGYLSISSNDALTNVDGFSSLTSVGGYMYINNNAALTNVDGFSSLTSVDGDYIRICGNAILSSIPSFFTTLSAGKTNSQQCLRTGSSCC